MRRVDKVCHLYREIIPGDKPRADIDNVGDNETACVVNRIEISADIPTKQVRIPPVNFMVIESRHSVKPEQDLSL